MVPLQKSHYESVFQINLPSGARNSDIWTDLLAPRRVRLESEELERLLHPQQLCRVPRPQRVQLGLLQRRLQGPLLGVEAEEAPRQRVRSDR